MNNKKNINEDIPGSYMSRTNNVPSWEIQWNDFKQSASDPKAAPDASLAVKVVLHRNGKCLFLRNEDGLDLPGGKIEPGESDIATLKREVWEETGLTMSTDNNAYARIFGLQHSKPGDQFFVADLPAGHIYNNPEEHSKPEMYTFEEALERDDVSPGYKEVIEKVLEMKNEQGPLR